MLSLAGFFCSHTSMIPTCWQIQMPSRLQEMANTKADRNDLAISERQEERNKVASFQFGGWNKELIISALSFLKAITFFAWSLSFKEIEKNITSVAMKYFDAKIAIKTRLRQHNSDQTESRTGYLMFKVLFLQLPNNLNFLISYSWLRSVQCLWPAPTTLCTSMAPILLLVIICRQQHFWNIFLKAVWIKNKQDS